MKKSKFLFLSVFLNCSISIWGQHEKVLHPAPYPQFSAFDLCLGDTATFINQTRGGVSYKWMLSTVDTALNSIQPIDSATTTNYTYAFTNSGLYELTLYSDNGHLTSLSRTLTIDNSTRAIFEFEECSNQFVNMSTCADQFYWEFGDGNNSSNPIPVHMYNDTGFYQVKLKAWKGTVIDSVISTIHLDVTGSDPSFTMTVTNNTITIGLVNPPIPLNSINWNFGDGNSVSGTTVATHVYPDSTASYYINVFMTNECGIGYKDTTILLESSVGIHEATKNFNTAVFPVPLKDVINIRSEMMTKIELIDMLGTSVRSIKEPFPVSSETIDISGLPPGHYILRLESNKGTIHKKVIKN